MPEPTANKTPVILDRERGEERPMTAEEQSAVDDLVSSPGFQASLREGVEDLKAGRGEVFEAGKRPS